MQISHYKIGELIGQGGMGRVFKATDTRLDRAVAIKIIDRDPIGEDWESGFLQEAKVLASLQHPNIVSLFDMGIVDAKPFLVMEYLDGGSIQSLLQEQTELPLRQILGIGVQICHALEYAHSKGVIHRDIKPGNIFRSRNNTVKVLDFGLSIAGPSFRAVPPTTRTEVPCGTYGYMSPEQLQGFAVDGQTDVYSTGLVIHELLARHSTSADATTVEGVPSAAAANGYLPVLLGSEYCDDVNNILYTALAPDRLDRYMATRSFGHALDNLKQRVERREIASLYERGCALVRTGDLKTHDHEITQILVELGEIDPACEEARLLMGQGLHASFVLDCAEILRLISPEERKFEEAEKILKKLYMLGHTFTQPQIDQVNFLAACIKTRTKNLAPSEVAQVRPLASWARTQVTNRAPAEEVTGASHEHGEGSSGISGRLTAELKFLFKNCSSLLRN